MQWLSKLLGREPDDSDRAQRDMRVIEVAADREYRHALRVVAERTRVVEAVRRTTAALQAGRR